MYMYLALCISNLGVEHVLVEVYSEAENSKPLDERGFKKTVLGV